MVYHYLGLDIDVFYLVFLLEGFVDSVVFPPRDVINVGCDIMGPLPMKPRHILEACFAPIPYHDPGACIKEG